MATNEQMTDLFDSAAFGPVSADVEGRALHPGRSRLGVDWVSDCSEVDVVLDTANQKNLEKSCTFTIEKKTLLYCL